MVITECNFKETKLSDPEIAVANVATTGTFIFITMNSTVTVSDSKFYDGISYLGGAIYILGKASVTLSNCDLYNNYAYLYGGAVYASKFASLIIK